MIGDDGYEWARSVEAALGPPGDQWGNQKRGGQGHKVRQSFGYRPEDATMADHADERGKNHSANTHRVDVVEVRPLEFNVLGTQSQRFVDDKIGHQCADPGHRDDAVVAERFFQRPVHA